MANKKQIIVDDVGSGHPVSRAKGSCIKRLTKRNTIE